MSALRLEIKRKIVESSVLHCSYSSKEPEIKYAIELPGRHINEQSGIFIEPDFVALLFDTILVAATDESFFVCYGDNAYQVPTVSEIFQVITDLKLTLSPVDEQKLISFLHTQSIKSAIVPA